jgi:carbon-monoxide dehydrogenase large subunit
LFSIIIAFNKGKVRIVDKDNGGETVGYNTVGKNVERIDAYEKVTGRAPFVADLKVPGMLYAKVLRSPYAHAEIKEIDISAALKSRGVVSIITGKDFNRRFGVAVADQTPLAVDRVRYVGEPVAAVVALTEEEAVKALKLIRVEYEELPFAIYPQDAVKKDAPVIHEEFSRYRLAPWLSPEGGNIYQHFKVRKGDIEKAFKEAYIVVENTYWSPYIHHVQLEPHGAVAQYNHDGSMIMHTSSQAPFVVQHCISELHDIPLNKVRVIVPYVGGGFGGKSDVTIEPLVSCIAKAVPGRPVKLMLTREEMFIGTTVGRGIYSLYKTAVSKEGKILGMEIVNYVGSGGYADYAVNIVSGAAMSATGPYEVPNLKVDCYGVYTNTPPVGAFRGYGHPEAHFAAERQMDLAARSLGMDPSEFRMKNLLVKGRENAIGQIMTEYSGRVDLCVKTVAEELSKQSRPEAGEDVAVGRGIAAYMKMPIMPPNVQSGAVIKLNGDGTVTVSVGAIEMGQGTYTALSQIAADALGIPIERVHINREVDTAYSPYEWQTVASHTTWGVGNAIIIASEDLKAKLKKAAANALDTDEDRIALDGEKIYSENNRERILSWSDLALGYASPKGTAVTAPIIGEGYFVAQGLENPDPETGQGNVAADWTFGCVGVELGVNKTTGEIRIYRLINAIDAGKIINPMLATNQVIGAMIQALGSTLTEKLIFSDKGTIRNNDLVDYKIPGLEDVPEQIKVIFVETPEETGPFGARGLGEHGAVAVSPAVANALYDAVKVDYFEIPITADKVIKAMKGVR